MCMDLCPDWSVLKSVLEGRTAAICKNLTRLTFTKTEHYCCGQYNEI